MVKAGFRSIFFRVLKYLGIAVVFIILVFGIASWVIVKKKNDWLLDQIQSYMNESQSGQLKIGSLELKLFRSFPDVAIALDSIDYYEHRDSLRLPEEQPILHADQLFIAFELIPLIREKLVVSQISLSDAKLNIVEVKKGVLNINLALARPGKKKSLPKKTTQPTNTAPPVTTPPTKKKTPPVRVTAPAKPGIQIDLQQVDLRNILLTWKSFKKRKPSVLLAREINAELLTDKNLLTAKVNSTYSIKSLTINDIAFPPGDLSLNAQVRYDRAQQLVSLNESEIRYEEFSASLVGTYSHLKNQMLDVQMDASSNDMEFLSVFLKPEVIKRNPDLLKNGDVYLKGRIVGELKKQPPQFDFSFGVKNLDLQLPRNLGAFKNLGFKGSFNSGAARDYSGAKFEINTIHGQLPGGYLKGYFHLSNFVEPNVNYQLDAKLKVDGYDEIFRINFLKQLSGSVSLQANFAGPLNQLAKHQMDSSRSSSIRFNQLSFVLAKNKQAVSLSGNLETRYNRSTLNQLALTYGNNDLTINATVDNLMFLLFKREREIVAEGRVESKQLFTKDFIPDTLLKAEVQDKINNLSFDFKTKTSTSKTPGRLGLPDITFEINKLTCTLAKLPDLKRVDASGLLQETANGIKLDLHEFHAIMPHGKVDVTGDLFVPRKKQWSFNAKVKATQFPWTYVMELVAEINDNKEPKSKNLSVKEMDIVTADIDLSASIITFPFDITKLDVRNSRIYFLPPNSKPVSVDRLNVALNDLHFIHPKNSGAVTGLKSTKGRIEMRQLGLPGLRKFDVKMDIDGANDQLEIAFASATQKAKTEQGKFTLDLSGREPHYQLHFSVEGASLEAYIKKIYKKKLMTGDISYTLDLRTNGLNWEGIKNELMGEITIQGDSLLLYGVDIDKVLKRYEKSQNFNLTDLGAVLIAGPIGLAVTKGTDFVSLAAINLDSSQRTHIQTLLTKWKLENRQLITEDVAFATSQNRIAFDGRIDFARDSIPGLTIAVIDKEGCSLMDQKLYGKTGKLKTGKLNITKTLFGSVINFVNAVVGKDCKPVYTGSVRPPLR